MEDSHCSFCSEGSRQSLVDFTSEKADQSFTLSLCPLCGAIYKSDPDGDVTVLTAENELLLLPGSLKNLPPTVAVPRKIKPT